MVVTGHLSDLGVVWMSKRNGGIYEPEFRLVFMISMLFGVFGYVGWAVGTDHYMPWIGAVACITYVHSNHTTVPALSISAWRMLTNKRAGCSTSAWSSRAPQR